MEKINWCCCCCKTLKFIEIANARTLELLQTKLKICIFGQFQCFTPKLIYQFISHWNETVVFDWVSETYLLIYEIFFFCSLINLILYNFITIYFSFDFFSHPPSSSSLNIYIICFYSYFLTILCFVRTLETVLST